MQESNTKTIYAIVKLKVKTDLNLEQTLDEVGQEIGYNFERTENVEIIDTELLEVTDEDPSYLLGDSDWDEPVDQYYSDMPGDKEWEDYQKQFSDKEKKGYGTSNDDTGWY